MKEKYNFTIPKKGVMSVPVKVFVNDKIMPNNLTISRLLKMATVKGIYKNLVALPDIHYKFNTSFKFSIPTGTVAVFKDKIIPEFINPDCGMSFITTNIKFKDIEGNIDSFFSLLKKKVSVSMRMKPLINKKELEKIIINGGKWAFDNYGFNKRDLYNIDNYGSMFGSEHINLNYLKSILPRQSFVVGRLGLGVLGTGNHFIELQRVDEILDKNMASKFKLKKDQIVFTVHTGSMFFGDVIHDYYSNIYKNKLKIPFIRRIYWSLISNNELRWLYPFFYKMNLFRKKLTGYINSKRKDMDSKINGLKVDSKSSKDYLNAKKIAMNYGIVNRLTLVNFIRNSLKEFFNDLKISILLDMNHDSLYVEEIEGIKYYVHRYGANRAYPKSLLKKHPLFSKTGQLIIIPGSMGNYSYLGVAQEGIKETFFSVNHGTGRILDKVEARNKYNMDKLNKEMNKLNVKLYRYGVGDIVEEIPSSFKDVNEVIKVMSQNNLAKPIAKLKPIAVLKGN